MRIRRRPADVLHRAQAPSSACRAPSPAAAPLPSVARAPAPCSDTVAARWQQPASEEDPSVCQGKPLEPRPPSRVWSPQEEREEGAKATEDEKRGKEDGRSEHEQKLPVHVVRSTPAAPKLEEEGPPTGAVGEKKSEDSRWDVKADEENSTAGAGMCKKGDGKGWHCKRVAQSGYSLCQHHLDKLRSYYSYSQRKKKQKKRKPNSAPVTEESTAAEAHNQGASRQKQQNKNKRRATEDVLSAGLGTSDSFYYYSGFGPRWGKRRSGDSRSVDGVMLPDGGASRVDLQEDAGDTAAAGAAAVAGGEEEEYYYDCDASSRDRKPLKSRALSSLL